MSWMCPGCGVHEGEKHRPDCGVTSVRRTPPEIAASVGHARKQELLDDPWAHRSAKMRCATCMWFVAKEVVRDLERRQSEAPGWAPAVTLGRCRRHAPTMSGFPAVYGTDWCGDHKLDEAKA